MIRFFYHKGHNGHKGWTSNERIAFPQIFLRVLCPARSIQISQHSERDCVLRG